jgi:hypothetical protein
LVPAQAQTSSITSSVTLSELAGLATQPSTSIAATNNITVGPKTILAVNGVQQVSLTNGLDLTFTNVLVPVAAVSNSNTVSPGMQVLYDLLVNSTLSNGLLGGLILTPHAPSNIHGVYEHFLKALKKPALVHPGADVFEVSDPHNRRLYD